VLEAEIKEVYEQMVLKNSTKTTKEEEIPESQKVD